VKFFVDNVVLIFAAFTSGLLLLWPYVQRRTAGPALNAHGATRLMNDQNAVVVDVRDPADFNAGHIPNAKHIPLADIEKRASELKLDKPIIFVCQTGTKAGKAASTLRKTGRENVFVLDAGLRAWKEAGLPIVK
jgi:rhodanese-related sulfurtransferase